MRGKKREGREENNEERYTYTEAETKEGGEEKGNMRGKEVKIEKKKDGNDGNEKKHRE